MTAEGTITNRGFLKHGLKFPQKPYLPSELLEKAVDGLKK
jgi:hypothetical protein